MSYDLFFRSRSAGSGVSLEDFTAFFTGRPKYTIKNFQAWYSNDDTGVYFVFEFNEPSDDDDDGRDPSLLPIVFNLNYFRPHPFGLEAQPEVAAFVRKFDLTVSDPQLSGMGDGDYSTEGFLRGWNTGNEVAYRAIATRDLSRHFNNLPSSQLEIIWRWNFQREALQNHIGEGAFIPRIFLVDVAGQVRTGVAWADGIPILLPVVDLVLVPRQLLSSRNWSHSDPDFVLFTWQELEPIVQRFRKVSENPECHELYYETTPSDIVNMIRNREPPQDKPNGVAFGEVLDRELLDEVRRA